MRSWVSFRSSCVSTLDDTVAILILCKGEVKSELKENESVVDISRDGGCFLRILNFPHAKDCKFLCRSPSGIAVEVLISC